MEGKPALQSFPLAGGSGSALHQIKRRSKNPPKVGSPSGTPREIDAGLVIAGHRFVISPVVVFAITLILTLIRGALSMSLRP